jgi:uncharacterized membrane protein (DUF106 family)
VDGEIVIYLPYAMIPVLLLAYVITQIVSGVIAAVIADRRTLRAEQQRMRRYQQIQERMYGRKK